MSKLELIIGRAGTGKTESCFQGMCSAIVSNPLGKPLLLIVPEYMTYQAERALAECLPQRGSMRAMVSSFRRLAWQGSGEKNNSQITDIGKRLILKQIIAEYGKDLSVLARDADRRGFTSLLSETIDELKSYHTTPEQLCEAAKIIEDKFLVQKLNDVSMLYEKFIQKTQNRFEDSKDRMIKLAASISKNPYFIGMEIWVDGFVFFNPQERDVLRELMKYAKTVHVTLPLEKDVEVDEIIDPTEIFYRASYTIQCLKHLAEETDTDYSVRLLEKTWRYNANSHGIDAIERFLFSGHSSSYKTGIAGVKDSNGVKIIEAATRRLEMEAVGADIIRLCREQGFRWRDIGILLRDQEDYGELLGFVLQEYDIPFFTDRHRSGRHHPLTELIRSALEIINDGWTYDDVFRCIKTDLMPLTKDEADVLENYVIEFGIRGEKSWKNEWPYYHIRSSESKEPGIQEKEYLETINNIRKRVSGPLFDLSEAMKKESVLEKTSSLYDFLIALKVPETLSQWESDAQEAGTLEEAKEHRMIWKTVIELFDQIVLVSGGSSLSLTQYTELLTDGLDSLELSLIPQKFDSVTISDFDQNSLNNIRALYILGANEGIMPRRSVSAGIFSDTDRAIIASKNDRLQFEFAQTADEKSCGEKYLLYHGLTEACEYLWISYALSDSEGKGLAKSSVINRMVKLLPALDLKTIALENSDKDLEKQALLSFGRHAVSCLVPALRKYISAPDYKERGDWAEVYNWAILNDKNRLNYIIQGLFMEKPDEKLSPSLAHRLFTWDKKLSGSVTRFERFFKCPFWHFAQYGLRLEPRREYGFHPVEVGILLHDVMRQFGEKMYSEGMKWSSITQEQVSDFVCGAVEKDSVWVQNSILKSSAHYQDIAERIENTATSSIVRLSDWENRSTFTPSFFEISFGEGTIAGEVLSYKIGNIKLDITGQIDRIDHGVIQNESGRQPYFLIIDYKTGNADVSKFDVKSYNGIQLQLMTYLVAAKKFFMKKKHESTYPAGIFYCMIKNPLVTENERISKEDADRKHFSDLRLKGWILKDREIIPKIDNSLRHIRVKINNDGSFNKNYIKSLKTSSEFDELAARSIEKLTEAGEAVLAGNIRIHPYRLNDETACDTCVYADICGFDQSIDVFSYHELAKPNEKNEDEQKITDQRGSKE